MHSRARFRFRLGPPTTPAPSLSLCGALLYYCFRWRAKKGAGIVSGRAARFSHRFTHRGYIYIYMRWGQISFDLLGRGARAHGTVLRARSRGWTMRLRKADFSRSLVPTLSFSICPQIAGERLRSILPTRDFESRGARGFRPWWRHLAAGGGVRSFTCIENLLFTTILYNQKHKKSKS